MTSALFSSVKNAVYLGASSYAFCRVASQPNPFEKAALVTVLVGLRSLAEKAVKYQQDDKFKTKPLTSFLIASASLLTIPCALYAGRVFNFKAVDYLQIVGLTSLADSITYGLRNLYSVFFSR